MEDAGPHGKGVIHDTQIVCHFSMARHRFQQYTALQRHARYSSSRLASIVPRGRCIIEASDL